MLPSAELEPVTDAPALEDLPPGGSLDHVAIVKLNGGLGTTMGLDGPKSLIEVKPGVTFLEVIALQARAAGRPLVLMSSFATQEATRTALPGVEDFVQGRFPRLNAADLSVRADAAPPGHGELYAALLSSGMRARLLARGATHVFASNSDNLGATPDPRIPAWVSSEGIPFLMEVVAGTERDRKGGHIARRDGRLVLRETAQVPPAEAESFSDFRRWRLYNANNLWIDLRPLTEPPDLPLILNRKTIAGEDVVQLETAMGAALGVIDGARVLRVPRSRFAPVKTTDDLLVVRSDAYVLHDDGRMEPRAAPFVALDRRFYGHLRDFDERFPSGPPSLVRARRLEVSGDVRFGRDVAVVGSVRLEGPAEIADGTVLDGA